MHYSAVIVYVSHIVQYSKEVEGSPGARRGAGVHPDESVAAE